ncbi:toxin TcdB middle/N-terminal domain-containing protein, partial [Hoeflea poritis]
PDMIIMANGQTLTRYEKRIKSIATKVSGVMRSAVALTYDEDPYSGASRLITITRYGTDAVVDASGTVTAGTARPPVSMTYYDVNTTHTNVTKPIPHYRSSIGQPINHTSLAADVNRDGIDELHQQQVSLGGIVSWLHNFDTSGNPNAAIATKYNPVLSAAIGSVAMNWSWIVASFDAAGEQQIVRSNYVEYVDSSGNLKASCINYTIIGFGQIKWDEPFSEACNSVGSTNRLKAVAVDRDGDMVSEMERLDTGDNSGNTFAGKADFRGNGHERTYFVRPNIFEVHGTPALSVGLSGTVSLYTRYAVDLNGDGASDFVNAGPMGLGQAPNIKLHINTGDGFEEITAGQNISVPYGRFPQFVDLNSDGMPDMLTAKAGASPYIQSASFLKLRTGANGHAISQASNYSIAYDQQAIIAIGDFNGDSISDPIISPVSGTQLNSTVWYSDYPDGTPGLLKSVTDELGGTVSLKYTPSSRFDHDFMPFVMPLVTSLSHDDGRGQVAETNYAYEGGKYDVAERRFLGFAKVTETKPLANGETARPSVETMLRQDVASYGRPESVTYKDGSGTVRKVVTHSYAVNAATKPYTALRTASETALTQNEATSGSPVTLTTRVERFHDVYGNVIEERHLGRTDVAGDETTRAMAYVANTADHIVSLPSVMSVHAGSGTSGALLSQEQLSYDGAAHGVAPAKGHVTARTVLRSSDGSLPAIAMSYGYDAHGNRTHEVDGEG